VTDGSLHQAMHALLRDVSARAILPYYQTLTAEQIEGKYADDVVTIADKLAEEMIGEGLRKIADLPVVGEEAAYADAAVFDRLSADCWIVDPVDGTRNFARGQPPFGILIARASGGDAVSGWIYDVLSDRFCSAEHGQGAFVNGQRIVARPTDEDPPVAAISLVFVEDAKREAIKAHVGPNYRLVDIPWCAAEQYPRLALGVNDVSMFERTLPWDHAAGTLWLNEAGGKAARPDGSPYRFKEWKRKGLLAAATPQLWDQLAGRLSEIETW
jgi:fructose-1,6-bisphosphatase/inositol monophosphatase family enzyme